MSEWCSVYCTSQLIKQNQETDSQFCVHHAHESQTIHFLFIGLRDRSLMMVSGGGGGGRGYKMRKS